MDDRQRQVQVGAGLQESNINQEFIDFLKKWGDWFLYGLLVVVALYAGSIWWGNYQRSQHNEAYMQYVSARGVKSTDGVLNGSPDNLLRVAEEWSGRGSVEELATLDAAQIYLACARRGIAPGGSVTDPSEEDVLSETERDEMYRRAKGLFERVVAMTAGKEEKALLEIRAQFGLAAAATSLLEFDEARAALERAAELSKEAGFLDKEAQAERELKKLAELGEPMPVYAAAELPEQMRPAPAPGRVLPSGGPGQTAQPIEISPAEPPVPTPAPGPAEGAGGEPGGGDEGDSGGG